jgi:hypothetical protein
MNVLMTLLKGLIMTAIIEDQLHNIVKNIDYSLRIRGAKFVLVASDYAGEGKSTFLANCSPLLAEIYKKKILIYDCQNERDDVLEHQLKVKSGAGQFAQLTETIGLEYVHQDDLEFLKHAPEDRKATLTASHFNEISKKYDVVFINMKVLKRAEKTLLPILPIDGAIIVRGSKSFSKTEKFITDELLDREIPVIGLIKNDGV